MQSVEGPSKGSVMNGFKLYGFGVQRFFQGFGLVANDNGFIWDSSDFACDQEFGLRICARSSFLSLGPLSLITP